MCVDPKPVDAKHGIFVTTVESSGGRRDSYWVLGIKLFAAKGKVAIQAQSDEMALAALKDVTITSSEGRLVLSAAKEVWIGAGGSYIKIDANRIENGTPGDIVEKCASWNKPSAASAQFSPALPTSLPARPLTLNVAASPSSTGTVFAGMPYTLLADGAVVKEGVIDRSGQIPIDHRIATREYRLELANGVKYSIPVADAYRGDASNGELANLGFHYHESGADGDIAPAGDRAIHRERYRSLLDLSSEASSEE
jgi:type VI secretion system secreted protein VgrG